MGMQIFTVALAACCNLVWPFGWDLCVRTANVISLCPLAEAPSAGSMGQV